MSNSYGYFKQSVTDSEIGSSTMPQKINPINFENAEGNLELSNCLLSFMSDKLQISRMQRDLSDTTVVRNIGVALGHAVVAYKSIMEGLQKLSINLEVADRDLSNAGLLAEAYQILLKKENVKDGYFQHCSPITDILTKATFHRMKSLEAEELKSSLLKMRDMTSFSTISQSIFLRPKLDIQEIYRPIQKSLLLMKTYQILEMAVIS